MYSSIKFIFICDVCQYEFASSDISKNWIYEKNDITPRQVFLSSAKKFWLKCFKCQHEFEKVLCRVKNNDIKCVYCSSYALCDNDECNFCFEKSLQSDPRSIFFIKSEHNKKPRQIFKKGEEKCTFKCDKCIHEFTHIIHHVTLDNCWCQFCKNRKFCEIFCYNKSFASHENAQYIVDKTIDLSRKRKYSNESHQFKCNKCDNIFYIKLYNASQGHFCPKCVNRTESILFDILIKEYANLQIQTKFEWCMGEKKKHFPFDFIIPDKMIIIELDGEQHFKDIKIWTSSHEEQRMRDVFKMNAANLNKYCVIRLLQTDVLTNKRNWKELLDNAIMNVDNSHGVIMNQFIAFNDIYKNHIEDTNNKNPNIKNIQLGNTIQ